jgi:hypothetical protein
LPLSGELCYVELIFYCSRPASSIMIEWISEWVPAGNSKCSATRWINCYIIYTFSLSLRTGHISDAPGPCQKTWFWALNRLYPFSVPFFFSHINQQSERSIL